MQLKGDGVSCYMYACGHNAQSMNPENYNLRQQNLLVLHLQRLQSHPSVCIYIHVYEGKTYK